MSEFIADDPLSLFPPERAERLRAGGSLLDVAAGESVKRNPGHFYIVVEGEIALVDRVTKSRVGSVGAGRALELSVLLTEDSEWRYDWHADTGAKLLAVDKDAVAKALSDAPEVKEYLLRLLNHAELRKFRTDLRLLGFAKQEICATINALKLCVVEDGRLSFATPHLALLQKGEAEMRARFASEERTLGHFSAGDYVCVGQGPEIVVTTGEGTCAWLIGEAAWQTVVEPTRVKQFLMFADPLKASVSSLRLRTQRKLAQAKRHAAKGEDEEEGGDEDDLDQFSATAEQLAALYKRKRPMVLQHDEMDCAAACLAMVAQFYGKRLTLQALRGVVNIDRDGASMLDLKTAAESLGFEAEGVMTDIEGLEGTWVPMVALMEYHFIVVYEVTKEKVVAGDPAVGLVTIPLAQFNREWSKMALLLRPTPGFYKLQESAPAFDKYKPLLGGAQRPLLEIAAAALLGFAVDLAPPLFMQFLFDSLLVRRDQNALDHAILVMAALALASGGLDWVRQYLTMHLSSRLDAKFASTYLSHTLRLPLGFFAVRRVGDITRRISEIDKLRAFVASDSVALLINVVSAVIYASLVALYSGKMLCLLMAVVPVLLLFIRRLTPLVEQNMKATFTADARAQSLAFEHFGAIETIKTLNANVAARWRWELTLERRMQLQRSLGRLSALINFVGALLMKSVSILVLMVSVKLYLSQELTLGMVVAVNALAASVISPILALAAQWTGIRQVVFALGRLDDVMTQQPEHDPRQVPDLPERLRGEIVFKNVGFRYGGDLSPQVLSEVSFKINAGETVALVGRSGSGKTTIGYLINRLYAPSEGTVLLDGRSASEFPLAFVRKNIGVVVQDNSTFSGTVTGNIALGDDNPSLQRVLQAAESADAHEFIAKMEHGYATKLGESGTGLSGGQKQRLNIARALYRDPAVLILDEATSSLDAIGEEQIMKALKANMRHRTNIIIAHRLNTVMWADRILVFDEGRLVESGSHVELMRRQEVYYELFSKQLETR